MLPFSPIERNPSPAGSLCVLLVPMKRIQERLVDAFVLLMMLVFAYLLRHEQPALAGVIVMAALKFWMDKNASEPHVTLEEAAALAAAKVLEVADTKAKDTPTEPTPPS